MLSPICCCYCFCLVAVVTLHISFFFFFFWSVRCFVESNNGTDRAINMNCVACLWKCVSETGSVTQESAGTLWSDAARTSPALRHSFTSKPPESFLDTGWMGAEGGVHGGRTGAVHEWGNSRCHLLSFSGSGLFKRPLTRLMATHSPSRPPRAPSPWHHDSD